MLQRLVGLDSVYHAGSHGFEIAGPEGASLSLEKGVEFLPELDQAERALRERLSGIAGHAVERKRFSIAVRYRRVAEADVGKLSAIVERMLGKKIVELRSDIDWNKGRAVLWLLERLGLNRPGIIPLYAGDDVTDEDAFRALAGRGLCIAVSDGGKRQTAADHALAQTGDVTRFLDVLAATC